MESERESRLQAITRLVEKHSIATQGELMEFLGKGGHGVDQSTLSRDLVELGIRKSQGRYVLASQTPTPAAVDTAGAVRSFTPCGPHLIVVRTGVGQAPLVGVHIDAAADSSITATVSGDDTLLVAVKSVRAQRAALRRLEQWFGDKHE